MSKSVLEIKRIGGPFGLRSVVSLLVDSVGFQQRGHRVAGPVFSTRIFGRELYFVDIGDHPDLAHSLLWAQSEQINLAAAYHDLFGRLFGEALFIDVDKQVRQGLTLGYIKRHVQATHVYLRQYLDQHLPTRGTIDGVEFFSELVLHTLMNYLCKDELCEQVAKDVAQAMATLENDYSVIGLMLPVDTPARRRRVAAREQLVASFETLVRHRLRSKARHEDFLQHLVDTKIGVEVGVGVGEHDEQAIQDIGLRLLGIVFGAHTNTSMSVPALLLDLLDRPEHLAAIREEIAAHAQPNGEVEFADLRKLTHLHRCITETLRLKSNGIMWRKAIVDLELGGRTIPAGSILGASTGLVNLDPTRFDAPQAFCPHRYDPAHTDQFQSPPVVKSPIEYCAFGTGRNVCSGRQLAYTLLASIFVRLLTDFDWSVEARPRAWINMFGPGVARPFGAIEFGYRRR
jgi:sterol 14alpha-demethylase